MADKQQQLGAGLAEHIKAYIDARVSLLLRGNPSTDSSVSLFSHVDTFLDPFNSGLTPLSLPLPTAFERVVTLLAQHSDHDHVVVHVSAHAWEPFYQSLLAAAKQHAAFLNTALNVQQRFGFLSAPSGSVTTSIITAGSNYEAISPWITRYDQVYSALLVKRYTQGQLQEEYQP